MDVDQFIRDLPWSDQATDYEKTLVAGNLRGFFSEVARATKPLFDAAVAIEQQVDEQSPTAGLGEYPDDHQIAVTLTLAEVRALTSAINRTGWADVANALAPTPPLTAKEKK